VTESLEAEIRTLRSLFWSDRDPDGRGFAPLADAYRRAGDAKQALELLGDGMDRHPNFTPGHVVAARLYVEQGLFTEAEIAARRVLDLDPENVDALRSLVRALDESGETIEAAKVREQIATLDLEPLEDETPADASAEAEMLATSEPEEETEIASEPEVQEHVDEFDPFVLSEVLVEEEDAVDLGALAPDEPVPAEESLPDFGTAPDEPAAVEEAEVMDFGALAPDEPEAVEEEVLDFDALAPDEPVPAEEIQTRTMADLYVAQGLIGRAIEMYEHLVEAAPDDAALRARLEELRAGDTGPAEGGEDDDGEVETLARDLAASGDAEDDVDTPFAWAEELSEPETEPVDGPSIGQFFDDLLNYRHSSEEEGL